MRSVLWFACGCILAVIMWSLLAPSKPVGPTAKEKLALEVQQSAAEPKQRISYPQGKISQITLPDGHVESVKSVLNMTKTLRFGTYVWDDKDVAPGPVWVRIDLDRQLLSVFRDGHEIGSTVILYGTDGKPTPTGTFAVKSMAADYHSRTYDAPMPYMLRLTDDGVAIHGSEVVNGSATHGCIGVPLAFAQKLFAQAKVGVSVYILPAKAKKEAAPAEPGEAALPPIPELQNSATI